VRTKSRAIFYETNVRHLRRGMIIQAYMKGKKDLENSQVHYYYKKKNKTQFERNKNKSTSNLTMNNN